jgi:hypothetical protein
MTDSLYMHWLPHTVCAAPLPIRVKSSTRFPNRGQQLPSQASHQLPSHSIRPWLSAADFSDHLQPPTPATNSSHHVCSCCRAPLMQPISSFQVKSSTWLPDRRLTSSNPGRAPIYLCSILPSLPASGFQPISPQTLIKAVSHQPRFSSTHFMKPT